MSIIEKKRSLTWIEEGLFALEESIDNSLPTAVRRACNRLRLEILQQDQPGQFLGSEEELTARLDISRPTFRQVARLLEQEQILTIKRGPGGGFFSKKPSFNSVVHQASICLVTHNSKQDQLLSVSRLLCVEAARLAALNPDQAEREQLRQVLGEVEVPVADRKRRYWLEDIWRFSLVMLEVAKNPVLTMFLHISMEFAAVLEIGKMVSKDHLENYLKDLRKLTEAIIEGDSEYAQLIASRLFGEMYEHSLADSSI